MDDSFNQIFAATLCVGMIFYIARHLYKASNRDQSKIRLRIKPVYDLSNDLTTISSFDLAFDAARAKSFLDNSGINSFVMDANVIALNQTLTWALGGVRLQVALKDASEAERILQESGFTSLTDLKNYHHCPACMSSNISCYGFTKIHIIAAVALFGALLLFFKRDYNCNNCQHEWRS